MTAYTIVSTALFALTLLWRLALPRGRALTGTAPAAAGSSRATPSVEACARCAASASCGAPTRTRAPARAKGLEGILVHGMLTMALAGRLGWTANPVGVELSDDG